MYCMYIWWYNVVNNCTGIMQYHERYWRQGTAVPVSFPEGGTVGRSNKAFDSHGQARRDFNLMPHETGRWVDSPPARLLLPHQIPGNMVYRFLLYLSPNSDRYLFSFFFAQIAICPTLAPIITTNDQLRPLTKYIPTQAMASNM